MIRGGSGLYLRLAGLERDVQPAALQPAGVGAVSPNDGRADFITNPTNGLTTDQIFSGNVKLPPQVVRTINQGFRSPYTWQSSIGFQKQINDVTGFDVDLTHYNEYRDTRTIDANEIYNPATGYTAAVDAGEPAEPGIRRRLCVHVRWTSRSDRTRFEPHAPLEEELPVGCHLDSDARNEG